MEHKEKSESCIPLNTEPGESGQGKVALTGSDLSEGPIPESLSEYWKSPVHQKQIEVLNRFLQN